MRKFNLYELRETQKNVFRVSLQADSSNGSVVTTTEYSENGFNDRIIDEIIDLVNNGSGEGDLQHYWNDWLEIPIGEDGSCHTLTRIDIEYIDHDGVVWNVKLNGDALK